MGQNNNVNKKKSDDELKRILSPLQYRVTQQHGTEPPFENEYYHNTQEGIYVDRVSGVPLFSSKQKYESGSGWPNFTSPINRDCIEQSEDASYGMMRIEVHSKDAKTHLGHVFDDGPAPQGKRYCINSASLRFIPVEKLDDEGYGEYKKLFK